MKRLTISLRRGLLALAGLGVLVPAPAVAQESVTLEEAIVRALEHSPALAQSVQAVDNAGWTRRTAVGSFLPSVSSGSSMSIRSAQQRDPTTGELRGGSSNSYGASLSASYDLFSGFARVRELNSASASVDAAEARLVDQRYAVVLQTQQLFFNGLRQEELVAVAEARVAQAEESLGLTRRQAQLQAATTSDTLRARLELVNARQALLQAVTASENARVSLGRQIGIAGPVEPVSPEAELDPRPLALSDGEILELAAGTAPSVLAAEASTVSAQASASASRSTYFPSLRMSSGYNWSNQVASLTGGNTSWSVGFSASFPIFNGFQRESQVARADQSLRVARLQEEDARLAARAEADAALRALRTAEQAIVIAQEALTVAREDFRVVQARYTAGVARIFDVVQSQIALDQARVDLVGARFDYVLARAELESIVGREL